MRDTMSRRPFRLSAAAAAVAILTGLGAPAMAQDLDYGGPETFDRHAPPPPPPSDPDYGPGYQRPSPFGRRFGDRRRRPAERAGLVCRTPEGACRSGAPQIIGFRCRCELEDGPVRGRMRP